MYTSATDCMLGHHIINARNQKKNQLGSFSKAYTNACKSVHNCRHKDPKNAFNR